MSNIKAYYCRECKKTTRHILQTTMDQTGGDILGRAAGYFWDKSGLADVERFITNEYQWKYSCCGRLTDRKADGTETFGYMPPNPK